MTEQQQTLEQQYAEQQRMYLDLTRRMAQDSDLGVVLPLLIEAIGRASRADSVRLLLSTSPTQWRVIGKGLETDAVIAVDEALLAMVAEQGEVMIARDTNAPPGFLPDELSLVAALPLVAHNTRYGVLWIGFSEARPLTDSERLFWATLAGQAAIALANARSVARLRRRYAWLSAVLDHTPDPVLVVDRDLHVQLMNPVAQQLFEVTEQAIIGQALDTVQELAGLVALFEERSSPEETSAPLEYALNGERTFAVSLSEVITEDDEQSGWVLLMQEITRYKRLHDNMSEFLSTVSHDMRTPLTYMKGYLDMLGMVGELNLKQDEFVGKIAGGFAQMSDMVEKILKAGRLDPVTGTYQLEREACDMVDMFHKVIDGLDEPAREKGIVLTYTVGEGVPVLNVDPSLIVSAFTNLAENAVKYTPEGGHIDVTLDVEEGELVFRVTDDGYGISLENQQKLFKRNSRIHRPEWKRVKGSGLGLFIVKNVAQRHGGDTWVESVEGEGSTFFFSLPLDGPNLVGGA